MEKERNPKKLEEPAGGGRANLEEERGTVEAGGPGEGPLKATEPEEGARPVRDARGLSREMRKSQML